MAWYLLYHCGSLVYGNQKLIGSFLNSALGVIAYTEPYVTWLQPLFVMATEVCPRYSL